MKPYAPCTCVIATDAKKPRNAWARTRRVEEDYQKSMQSVAAQIELLASYANPDNIGSMNLLFDRLNRYAELIEPWARGVAEKMVTEVNHKDEEAWADYSRQMSREMRREIETAPTGQLLQERMAEQVALIKSMPLESAQRVHEWTLSGLLSGGRANEISRKIQSLGDYSKAKADLIARTEVARTSSLLVESRARHVGSEGYIWRSVGDRRVRNADDNPIGSHRLLNGQFIAWNNPPVAAVDGTRAHAGQIWNCRCHCEPQIPDEWAFDRADDRASVLPRMAA